jgi:nitrate/nitrite transport system substrate-binding protein
MAGDGFRDPQPAQSAHDLPPHTAMWPTDGQGNIKEVPDRLNFDPFPWHSMAVWILTRMKRWNHVDGDLDYKKVAEQVYLAAECGKVSRELGYPVHKCTYTTHTIVGKVFDPEKSEEYIRSFAIHN